MKESKIKFSNEIVFSKQPLRLIKGMFSKYIVYPYGEIREGRNITSKVRHLRKHYLKSNEERMRIAKQNLINTISFAKENVPYYKALLTARGFDPEKLNDDMEYLNDIPLLTKTIIREQGERMLSQPLDSCRHYERKTGGSTGESSIIFYDQEAIDYSAAVTLYVRERIGKTKIDPELHFASRFPDHKDPGWRDKEFWKCLALNRSNIFFNSLDDRSLDNIWKTLQRRRPKLIHAHSSTIYALACYVEKVGGRDTGFEIFESSGETLQPYMLRKIEEVLNCKVVNRYGLAEAGIIAYQLDLNSEKMQFLESECWPEEYKINGRNELLITTLRNKLMPLIRYSPGDEISINRDADELVIEGVIGRMHDLITVNGVPIPTHHIMDVIDHRIGNIQEFQINTSTTPNTLRLVIEAGINPDIIKEKIEAFWPGAFSLEFVDQNNLVRVGRHGKFKHIVDK